MNDSFRLNFRAKVLGLASNPTPESILNIISVVKKHEVVREDLVHGLAMDAVLNCTSFQGYDKIQSLLVFAVVIEAEVDHEFQKQNHDYHSTKEHESVQEKLVPLCDALCHLIVSSTAYIRTAMYDSPGASTKNLIQKANQLFQRALVDSDFVFVNSIWKSFLQVAHNEKSSTTEKNSQEAYKFALLYAKSIYDMVPTTLQNYDQSFFDQELKTVGDVDFNELQRWLRDEVFVVKRQITLNDYSSHNTEPNSTDLESERLSSSSFDNQRIDQEYNQIVIFNGTKNPQASNTEPNLNQLEDQQMDADTVKDDRKLVVFDPYGPKATTLQKEEESNRQLGEKEVQNDLFESPNNIGYTSLSGNNQLVAYNERISQGNDQMVESDGQDKVDEGNLITMKDDIAHSDINFGSKNEPQQLVRYGTHSTLVEETLVVKGKTELNDNKDVHGISDSYAEKGSDINDMDQQIQISLQHDTFQTKVGKPKPDLLTLPHSTSTTLNENDTERDSIPSHKNHPAIASSSVDSIESNAMKTNPNPLSLPPLTSSNFKTSSTDRDTSPSDRNRSSRASSVADGDVLAPLQNEHRHFNMSRNNSSYEERIQAKQKGIAAAPIRSLSYRSESSGSILANDEAAKIERRIAAKTAGHYESERSVNKFAMASFSSNMSESSRSSSISTLSKSKGRQFPTALKRDVSNSHSSHEEDSIGKKSHSLARSNYSGSECDTKDDDLSLASRDASLASKDQSKASMSSFYSQDTAKLEQKINSIWQKNKTSSKEDARSEAKLGERSNTNTTFDSSAAYSVQSNGAVPEESLLSNMNYDNNQIQNTRRGSIFQLPSDRTIQDRRENSSSYMFGNEESPDTTALLDESENDIQPPGEDSGIAVATAVEKECIDNADDAIMFDPKSRARMMNKKLYIWTVCALISAITVAIVLGVVFTKQNEPIITSTLEPTAPPTTSYYWTIKQHVQASFGENKPYDDLNSPYGKALHWLAASDLYIFSVKEQLNDAEPKVARNNSSNHTETRFIHDISTRYFLALFYYQMSGDLWVNCSASNLAPTTGSCSFFNRDSDLINGKKNWLSSTSVCEWAGITCGEDDMSIERMELNKLGLKGSIPTEIEKLSNLQYLILFENQISGQIPSQLGKLDNLVNLDFYSNSLEGEIPEELYDLSGLILLHCGKNDLNGTLSEKIRNMGQLQVLYLFQNELSGIIPESISDLNSTLEYLSLKENSFNGSLPLAMERLTNLKELSIGKNEFSGKLILPPAKNLVTLQIQNNAFEGSIPNNLYKLNSLKYLIADNNKFSGSIEATLGSLSDLTVVSFRENRLSGTIPEEISDLISLEILRLHRNEFNGSIPDLMCKNLQQLISFYADCENNLIAGDLYFGNGQPEIECSCCTDCCSPGPQGECIKRVTSNALYMSKAPTMAPTPPETMERIFLIQTLVMTEFGNSSLFEDEDSSYSRALDWLVNDIFSLDAAEQLLEASTGSNPMIDSSEVSNRYMLDISNRFTFALFYYDMTGDMWNNCSGQFDFFVPDADYTCSYTNRESQVIPGKSRWLGPQHVCSWAGLTCDSSEESVVKIELNNMGLSGTIPTEISRLQDLEYLTLFENEITGQIPTSIGVIQNLRILDLFSNQLIGSIPIEVYDLSNLLVLRLGDNAMDGTISNDIQKLSALQELSLKSNYFSGTLPDSFEDLTQLRDLSIQQNEFDGRLSVPSSSNLEILQIQENRFNGTLPQNLYELTEVKYVVGDANDFTGVISSEIGNLSALSLFSFRDNELSGVIPEEFSNLSNLETLHLHHNKFYGAVAESICQNLNILSDFFTDCLGDDSAVYCECCTDCCVSEVDGGCEKRQHQNERFYEDMLYHQFGYTYTTASSFRSKSSQMSPQIPSLSPSFHFPDEYQMDDFVMSRHYSKKKGSKSKGKGKGKVASEDSISYEESKSSTITTTTTTTTITTTTTNSSSSSLPTSVYKKKKGKGKKKSKYKGKKSKYIATQAPANPATPATQPGGNIGPTPGLGGAIGGNEPTPGLGGANGNVPTPKIPTSSPTDCTDLDNCKRPTNPTSKDVAPQRIPSTSIMTSPGVGGANAPKVGGATAPKTGGATAPSAPTILLEPIGDDDDVLDYLANDCDDLDNCNRPTNPTSYTMRFSNRKPSSFLGRSPYGSNMRNSGGIKVSQHGGLSIVLFFMLCTMAFM